MTFSLTLWLYHSATLQITQSWPVPLMQRKEGMPFGETWTRLRSDHKRTSWSLSKGKVLHLGPANPIHEWEMNSSRRTCWFWWMETSTWATEVIEAQERCRHVRMGPEQATKVIRGLQHLPYEDRLRELQLFSTDKTRLCGNLIASFQYLKWTYKKEKEKLFRWADSDRQEATVLN